LPAYAPETDPIERVWWSAFEPQLIHLLQACKPDTKKTTGGGRRNVHAPTESQVRQQTGALVWAKEEI
jgi:hypothetical protein